MFENNFYSLIVSLLIKCVTQKELHGTGSCYYQQSRQLNGLRVTWLSAGQVHVNKLHPTRSPLTAGSGRGKGNGVVRPSIS